MNFYCKVCARMQIDLINRAVKEAKDRFISEKVVKSDIKSKAKILKTVLKDSAVKANIGLD